MTNTREFRDTIPVQRREPMPFEPLWYRRRNCVAACYGQCEHGNKACPSPDACRLPAEDEDSEFGALEGLVHTRRFIGLAWLVIFAAVAVFWWLA